MQINDLKLFVALFERGSINAVARADHFAQSNLSVRLQKLEAELGVVLFTRTPRGIEPTPAGETVYRYAKTVLAETHRLHQALAPQQSKRTVIISELLFNYLVTWRHQLSLAQNDFQLRSSTAIGQLQTPAADLVITYANFRGAGFLAGPVRYLPARFLAAKPVPDLPVLVNADRHCPFRKRSQAYLRDHPRPLIEIDSWASILALVKQGRGMALLPDYFADRDQLTDAAPGHHYRIPYRSWHRR